MTKTELITHLKTTCKSWGDVYELFKDSRKCFGWFVAYDGESIYDMHLTNTDPQGDESGGVIFHGDVF